MLIRIKFFIFFLIITSTLSASSFGYYLSEKEFLFPVKQDTVKKKLADTSFRIQADTLQKKSPPTDKPLTQPKDTSQLMKQAVKDSLLVKSDSIKVIEDTIPAIRDSMAIHYFYQSFDNFTLGKIYPLDTSLHGIQNYDPSYRAGTYYASLGNVGLPAKNLQFEPQINEGFNYVTSPLDIYTYRNKDVKYYRLFRPFTEIFYVMGPKKENNLRVLLTQNVSRGLTLGVRFKFINAPGIYQKQRSDNKNLYVTARYSTRNGRYGFVSNYIHDKLITQENGGLKSDSAFIFSLETNRALIDVNLQDATNTYKKGSVYFNQYFNLGKAPSITTDSLGNKIKHEGLPLGRLSHTLFIERKQFFFENVASDTLFFAGFDEILNKDNTFDSTSIVRIENQFQWSNINYKLHTKEMPLYLYFGIKQQHIKVSDTTSYQKINNLIPKAGISVFLFNSFRLKADAFYVMGDHNDGDYSLSARLSQQLGTKERNFGYLSFAGKISKQSPSYFYNLYRGNYLRWENDFTAENHLTLQASYSFKGIKASIKHQKFDNYIFMDQSAHPSQTEITQSVLSAALDLNMKYKDFTLDAHLVYQKPKSDSLLRLPELLGSVSINYTKALFKNATTIQPGIEVFYNTEYFADAYMPATRSFYLQDEKKIGGAIYADFYLNFTIKNTLFFFKYQHFNAAVTGYNYFQVPHYPMQDYAIKFGIIWRFMD